jgi:pimeloyl-ACP methyl ester carboxylesterase
MNQRIVSFVHSRRLLRDRWNTKTSLLQKRVFFSLKQMSVARAEKIQQPMPLPEPLIFRFNDNCSVSYVDIQPKELHSRSKSPILVLLHGSPGTYQDFRYLIPHLGQNMRLIAIDLPGFGGSVISKTHFFEMTHPIKLAHAVLSTLQEVCRKDDNVVLLGHSLGGHTALNVAAINLQQKVLRIRGMGFLASAGCRAHRALMPVAARVGMKLFYESHIPFAPALGDKLMKFFYTKLLGFRNSVPESDFVAGTSRVAKTDFSMVNQHIQQLSHIPSFCAWTQDDEFMEEEIPLELSKKLYSGPRILFKRGGHNIQKTKADILGPRITEWAQEVCVDNQKDKVIGTSDLEYME